MKRLLACLFLVLGLLLWCNVGFAECIKGDCNNGYGTYTWESGDKYVGEHKDGKGHGQGTYTFADGDKYVGEHKDGKGHGQGTYTYANGDKYVGEFKDGKRHGQGTITWASGGKYVGELKDGKQHGQGTHTWESGDKYVGEHKDGKWHGQGTYTKAGGSKYVGEWKDGKENGQGTYIWASGEFAGDKYVGEYKDGKWHGQGTYTFADGTVDNGIWKIGQLVKRNKIQTQITKKEPTQMQEVAKSTLTKNKKFVKLKVCGWDQDSIIKMPLYLRHINLRCPAPFNSLRSEPQLASVWDDKYYLQLRKGRNIKVCLNLETNGIRMTSKSSEVTDCKLLNKDALMELYVELKFSHIDKNNNKIAIYYYETDEIQIAKKEPKKKKKKEKKKVAKVVEQEQEEFKPKKKDLDTDPPRIEIAETITVGSQSYTIEGRIRDKSQFYFEIDGRRIEVKKNGKFEFEGFAIDSEKGEELKLVAIDRWKNKSEKNVKIIVELKSTAVAKVYERLNPNKIKVSKSDNKIAIIIGIERYDTLENLDAPFANRDANAFREYASRALGVKSSNIKLLVDSNASRPKIFKALKLWLPKTAGESTDIYIFFAGHGLASDNGKDLYILPQDGDASLLEDTAITRVEIIKLLQKVNPNSVTMFFDTCYSGQTRDERMLVASLRPIRIVASEQDTPNNFTIFSASNFDQTSGSIEEIKHGMFSYYLMKGLEGKADGNKDKQITNGELIAYLKTNVSKEAFTQNREQDPMLSGDPDQVLM